MKKSHFILFCVLMLNFINAQTITFISERTNKPLPKVSVFAKDGSIIAYSDIDGKIDKQLLKPDQEKFQLVHNNLTVGTLSYADFNQDVIKIFDNVKNIETVVIKNKPAKYIFLKGTFNAYVTVNNKLNCYTDGIITYTFDNKTKKLKNKHIQQYRVYSLEDPKEDNKNASTWDYSQFLETPKLKDVDKIAQNQKDNRIKELKGNQKDEIEITSAILQEKAIALFGYRLFDSKKVYNIAYMKDSQKTIKDLLEYNEIESFKFKHKSEPDFNAIIVYGNFYPEELSYKNDTDLEKVKFNTDNSNYTTQFWKEANFPDMQNIFSSFFGADLKEQQNKK